MDLDTPALRRLQIIRQKTAAHRRHYVTAEDVKIVLSRLPEELWSQLRKVHLNDRAKGRRTLGYTTNRGRREISLCALPIRVSLNGTKCRPEAFGALRGSQWPVLAIRRFMLYDVLLHELGHLQVILPDSKNPNRKFASETKAQKFADTWRKQLWSKPFDHPDPVHNPPDDEELDALKTGWIAANLAYKRGQACDDARAWEQAAQQYRKAIELYPAHALALEGLGMILWRDRASLIGNEDKLTPAALLRKALQFDPGLLHAGTFLALVLNRLGRQDEAREWFERALRIDPRHYRVMTIYADVLTEWGCYQEAESRLARVMHARPSWIYPRENYARLLMARSPCPPEGDLRKAVELLQTVVAAEATNADAYLGLATAFSKLPGGAAEAVRHARQVLELRPEDETATALLARLAPDEATQG